MKTGLSAKRDGRQKLLNEDDIRSISFDLNKCSGSTISTVEIAKKIEVIQKENAISQGRVPITKGDMRPSRGTLINYQAVIAST